MRIICMANLCENVPDHVPDGDVIVIAGNIFFGYNRDRQKKWFKFFTSWLESIPHNYVLVTPGSYDYFFWFHATTMKAYKQFTYISDDYKKIDNYIFYLTPWSIKTRMSAPSHYFQSDEAILEDVFSRVEKADIIVSHGPPLGFGDTFYSRDDESTEALKHVSGSVALLNLIDRISPKLVVYGSVVDGYGIYQYKNTLLVNACLSDKNKLVNKPIIIEI